MTWSIPDSQSINRKEFSIVQKIDEILQEVSGWLDRFSIPVWLIERNIWSIEGNSQSFEKLKKFTPKFLDDSINCRFLFNRSKGIRNQSKC